MEVKKKKSLAVDRYNPVFREAGIAIALALVLMSFNMKSKPHVFEPAIEIEPDGALIDPVVPITKLPPPKKKQVETEARQSLSLVRKLVFTEKKVDMDTVDLSIIDMEEFELDLPPVDATGPVLKAPEIVDFTELSAMPQFPGGHAAFADFLRKNLKYPARELQWDIEGKVYLQFTINKKGKVKEVEVVKGATENFNTEALRVGKMIPAWTPGMQNGSPVKCRFLVPIVFRTR